MLHLHGHVSLNTSYFCQLLNYTHKDGKNHKPFMELLSCGKWKFYSCNKSCKQNLAKFGSNWTL